MKRYWALRAIAIFWRVLAALILVVGIFGSIGVGAEFAFEVGLPEGVLIASGIVFTLLLIIPLLAFSELIAKY